MSYKLETGKSVSLSKLALSNGAPLERVVVACGWDVNKKKRGFWSRQADFDLDLTAACLDASGKVPAVDDPTDPGYQEWFVHANHRFPSVPSVVFTGDNRTGAGKGDDEQIKIDVTTVSETIERILFAVVIWRGHERGQRFGAVENAFIRIFNETTGEELVRFDLTDRFAEDTLVVLGELVRVGTAWFFKATGQGYDPFAYRQEFNIVRPFETEYARYSE